MKHQPITNRFTAYSEADKSADALWDFFKSGFPFEVHGGAFLHEQPPHIQHLVCGFAETRARLQRMIEIAAPPIVVEKGSNLAESLDRSRSVSVLDTWRRAEPEHRGWQTQPGTDGFGPVACLLWDTRFDVSDTHFGKDEDAARKAAADAIEKGQL